MDEIILRFLWVYIWLVLVATIGLGIYGIIVRPSMLKKIIALTILGDTANVFMIYVGYRAIYPVKPPILWTMNPNEQVLREFASQITDPIPPALVITAIVINMAITVLITFLAIQAYRLYGTLDSRKISELKG